MFFEVGLKGHFCLNILLTLLGYIPGIIHALYVICAIKDSQVKPACLAVQ